MFDQQWDAVVAGCDRFLSSYPDSTSLPRAMYYRAQALEQMKGREEEAIAAYSEFVRRFPRERGTLREDAMLSRITLATSLWMKGQKGYVTLVMEGMKEPGYAGLFAAIQASKIGHRPARSRARPILQECARSQSDAELKSECKLALLRMDPNDVLDPDSAVGGGDPASEVKLIRLEIRDKGNDKVTVRVNMPIAFAELLLDSLSQIYREEISMHLHEQGVVNLEEFWKAIKEGGKQTIVEIDGEDESIRIWVE